MPEANTIIPPPATGSQDEENTPRLAACDVEIVRTERELDALAAQWSDLFEAADVSVFQSYEWIRTWWTYFGKDRKLRILVFRDQGRLVGIAPLFVERARFLGIPVARHIQFIGVGLSDYTDIIMLPGYEPSVLEGFARHLRATPEEWDVLDLEDVNEHSPVVRLLLPILQNQHVSVYQYRANVCPSVEMPERAEDLLQELGRVSRYNFRRKFRLLQTQFKTEVKLFRSEQDDLRKAVTDFSFIHGERWKSLGFPSAFDNERHREFHIEVATKFAKRDWLRMFFLNVDGLPVAVSFCFNFRRRIYMYQSNAYGSDAVMKCSPGFLVRSVAMVEGISEGMRVFDFLRGSEEYKYREWDAVDSQNWLIRATSPLPQGEIRFMLFLAAELAGKMRRRFIQEYHEFKRMRLVKKPTPGMLANYILTKAFHLLELGFSFIMRHSPLGRRAAPEAGQSDGRGSYQALKESDSSSVFQYTLGQKVVRMLRSLKINNLVRNLRTRLNTEKTLEDRTSQISGSVRIAECGIERQLLLNSETHSIFFTRGSWAEAKREYWGAMSESPFGIPMKASVLACGLGGGTTLHLLQRSRRHASITVLEIDPVVIDSARRHFSIDSISGLTIIEGDAAASIRNLRAQQARYDLILDDVFYSITGKLTHSHQAVIKSLISMLNQDGSVTFQRPIDRSGDETASDRFADSLREMGYDVRVRKIRHRWSNDVIYCRAQKK